MKKAILHLRVSTDEQADKDFRLASQEEYLRNEYHSFGSQFFTEVFCFLKSRRELKGISRNSL
ncbi:MAG TPA: hypothetical protein VJ184_14105, partial [Chryseolinea sp.]|nr:hypothetical protein [Chryseolinea sp.]